MTWDLGVHETDSDNWHNIIESYLPLPLAPLPLYVVR